MADRNNDIGLLILRDLEIIDRQHPIHFGEALAEKNFAWLQKLNRTELNKLKQAKSKDAVIKLMNSNNHFFYQIMEKSQQDDGTYIKKKKQIEKLSENHNGFKCQLETARQLCTIYLYIKIVRNLVCHVSEVEVEKDVVEFLRANGCEVEPISIDNIKENINLALNLIQNHN